MYGTSLEGHDVLNVCFHPLFAEIYRRFSKPAAHHSSLCSKIEFPLDCYDEWMQCSGTPYFPLLSFCQGIGDSSIYRSRPTRTKI